MWTRVGPAQLQQNRTRTFSRRQSCAKPSSPFLVLSRTSSLASPPAFRSQRCSSAEPYREPRAKNRCENMGNGKPQFERLSGALVRANYCCNPRQGAAALLKRLVLLTVRPRVSSSCLWRREMRSQMRQWRVMIARGLYGVRAASSLVLSARHELHLNSARPQRNSRRARVPLKSAVHFRQPASGCRVTRRSQ